jgi:acyl carrier protein
MAVTRAQVLQIIYECIDELNEQLMPEQQLAKDPNVVLFGPSGYLDSLGFVNLIALLEERCERYFKISLSLSEGRTDADNDQVHTVAELANRIGQLVVEKTKIEA